MEIPLRFVGSGRAGSLRVVGLLLLGALLTSCATVPSDYAPVSLDTPAVSFPNGRVTLYLVDEDGMPMVRTKVDFAWETPQFYRTSGFTDNIGRVTFAGVPEVADVSIDHPGGNYSRTLIVPQRGTSEMRVMLYTYGANGIARNVLRAVPPPAQ